MLYRARFARDVPFAVVSQAFDLRNPTRHCLSPAGYSAALRDDVRAAALAHLRLNWMPPSLARLGHAPFFLPHYVDGLLCGFWLRQIDQPRFRGSPYEAPQSGRLSDDPPSPSAAAAPVRTAEGEACGLLEALPPPADRAICLSHGCPCLPPPAACLRTAASRVTRHSVMGSSRRSSSSLCNILK